MNWRFTMKLTCGHVVDYGEVGTLDCRNLTPRRADDSFGSLRCPSGKCGRRRVTATCSSFNGEAPWSGEHFAVPLPAGFQPTRNEP